MYLIVQTERNNRTNRKTSDISAPRNQELMRIFRDLKLVEQMGSGMRRILAKYDKTIFAFSPNYLRVTFPFDELPPETLNETSHTDGTKTNSFPNTRKIVLHVLKENPAATYQYISSKTGLSRSTVARAMQDLQNDKKIVRIGAKKSGYWQIRDQ